MDAFDFLVQMGLMGQPLSTYFFFFSGMTYLNSGFTS